MISNWGVIALFAAAVAFAPNAYAGNGRGNANDDRDQCRENDPGRHDSSSDRGEGPLILHADADGANLFIHGTGFGTGSGTVTFGGQRLAIAAWSPSDIVAVMPSNPQPASYLLSNASGVLGNLACELTQTGVSLVLDRAEGFLASNTAADTLTLHAAAQVTAADGDVFELLCQVGAGATVFASYPQLTAIQIGSITAPGP